MSDITMPLPAELTLQVICTEPEQVLRILTAFCNAVKEHIGDDTKIITTIASVDVDEEGEEE